MAARPHRRRCRRDPSERSLPRGGSRATRHRRSPFLPSKMTVLPERKPKDAGQLVVTGHLAERRWQRRTCHRRWPRDARQLVAAGCLRPFRRRRRRRCFSREEGAPNDSSPSVFPLSNAAAVPLLPEGTMPLSKMMATPDGLSRTVARASNAQQPNIAAVPSISAVLDGFPLSRLHRRQLPRRRRLRRNFRRRRRSRNCNRLVSSRCMAATPAPLLRGSG